MKRFSLMCLAAVVWSCADSDRKQIERLDAQPASPGDFSVQGLTLTTLENTPVSGIAFVAGYRGTLTTSIVQQGTLGTLAFGAGTSFTYTPKRYSTGTDTVIVSVTDGTGVTLTATIEVVITAVDQPPQLTGVTTLTMAEDTSLTLTLASVSVVDPDSPASDITLTLLPSTQYQSTGNTLRPPLNFNGNLVATVRLSDGQASTTATITITVTPVNDAPFETVPTPQQTAENTAFTFGSNARIRVTDVDAGDSPLLAQLSTDNGTITLASTTGLTFSAGDGTSDAVIHFSGSQTAINAALDGMVVTPPTNFTGLITLTFYTNDQGATGAGGALSASQTFALGVGSVELPPFARLPAGFNLDEDTSYTFHSSVTVGDSDLSPGDSVTADIIATSGVFTLSTTSGLTFSLGNGVSNPHMTFSGTPADINVAFNGMVYTPSPDFAGTVTVTLTVHSSALSDTDSLIITMNPIDDPPSITALESTVEVAKNTTFAFTGASAITVGDIDAATGNVTMTVTSGTGGSIAMAAAGAATLQANNAATSIVANGTISDLASTIATLTFTPAHDFTGQVSLGISVDDNGNTGAGGPLTTSTTIAINVIVPDPTPVANADTYDTMGNTDFAITAKASGVLGNDVVTASDVITTTGTIATTLGGSVAMNADGTFTYTPPVGHGSATSPEADTFQYTVANTTASQASATVTIKLHQVIWYVQSDSSATTPTGLASAPFTTTTAAAAQAQAGQIIYVRDAGTAYAGFEVKAGVTLTGSGIILTRQPYNANLDATASVPKLQNGVSTVLTLDSNATVQGVDVSAVGDGPFTAAAIAATGVHDVTIKSVTIHDHGTGIAIADCTGATTVDQVTITTMAANGIDVTASANLILSVTNTTVASAVNGIDASIGDGAVLDLTIDNLTVSHISGAGVSVSNDSATSQSTIVVRNSFFNNQPTLGGASLGTAAIAVTNQVGSSSIQVDVENSQFSEWQGSGIDLLAIPGIANQITALLDGVVLGNPFGDSFSTASIHVNPGDGNADLTLQGSGSTAPQGAGLLLDGGTVCMSSTTNNFSSGSPDYLFNSGTISLAGYNPGAQTLTDYLTNTAGDLGTFTATVTPVGATSCAQVVLP